MKNFSELWIIGLLAPIACGSEMAGEDSTMEAAHSGALVQGIDPAHSSGVRLGTACAITGEIQARLDGYQFAGTKKIWGQDVDTGGVVTIWFNGGCWGLEAGINRTFYLDASERLDLKDALDGPGRVNFRGIPDPNSTRINQVAWEEVP